MKPTQGDNSSTIGWWLVLGSTTIIGLAFIRFWMNRYSRKTYSPSRKTMNKELAGEASLVNEARRLLVASGDAEHDVARAMQALAALIEAVRLTDGEAAASALLERGRALFKDREGTDGERDDALINLEVQETLLKERGMEGILGAAFSDGSSVLCRRCSGLVSRARWDAHKSQWCPAIVSRHDLLNEEDEAHENREDDDMEVIE